MQERNKVYVVIVTHNGCDDTLECLEAVLRSEDPCFEVVVVDNASADGTRDGIRAWAQGERIVHPASADERIRACVHPSLPKPYPTVFMKYRGGTFLEEERIAADDSRPRLTVIDAGDNLGFSFANNIGMRYALEKGDIGYIWLLNNDTVVPLSTLSTLRNAMLRHNSTSKKVGIIGGKLLFYHQPDIIQGVGGRLNYWTAVSQHIGAYERDEGQYDREDLVFDYVIGACMFIDRAFIEDVGLMNEEYFLYFEEPDWILRGRRKGWRIGYCPQAIVYHKEGGFSGTAQKGRHRSLFSDYYGLRNRPIFMRNFFPRRLPVLYLSYAFVFFNRLRRKQFGRLRLAWDALCGRLPLRFTNRYE